MHALLVDSSRGKKLGGRSGHVLIDS